jgi:predicted adenylyl cyclase CyaB
MREVEVKILEINEEKVVDALTKLNAKKVFDGEIVTSFLDFEDCRIHKRKDVLRLRQEGNVIELTFKKIKITPSTKEAEEISTHISDLDSTLKILQEIGISITQQMRKHRISYQIDSMRFDIDSYLGDYSFIPEFLEIEGTGDEIKQYAQLLGFEEKECLPWSTDEIIKHYLQKT